MAGRCRATTQQGNAGRRQDGGWAGRRMATAQQGDRTAGRRHSRTTASQDKAGRRRATAVRWRLMAAASQVKTAALAGSGVFGQTLSFPNALIPC